MAVVALAGTPGSPGTTTSALALLLSWPLLPDRRVLLAECDPDGGSVLTGALGGRTPGAYGLRNLALADRQGQLTDAFWRQLIDLSDDRSERLLLPGLTDFAQAASLDHSWGNLATLFASVEHHAPSHDVLVDLGRSGSHGPASVLARKADLVLLVVRGTLRGVHAAEARARTLVDDLQKQGTGADALSILLIDAGLYDAAEVSKQLHAPVLATLPQDAASAAVLSDGAASGRRFQRAPLMRAARTAAEAVQAALAVRRARLAPRPPEETTAAAPLGFGPSSRDFGNGQGEFAHAR
jgi:hypothetical protein